MDTTQNGLLAVMLAEYDTLELAKEISEKGYIAFENLILVKQSDGTFCTVEGNRRLSACIALRFPNRVPTHLRKIFDRLSKITNTSTFSSIPSLIVSSRVESLSLLAGKHSGDNHVKKWTPIVQSNFYANAIEITGSFTDACEAFGMSPIAFRNHLLLHAVLKYYKGLAKAQKLSHLDTVKAFNTTLARVFETSELTSRASFEISDSGDLIVKSGKATLNHVLPRLVNGLLAEVDPITSRNTNDGKSREALIATLLEGFIDKKPEEPRSEQRDAPPDEGRRDPDEPEEGDGQEKPGEQSPGSGTSKGRGKANKMRFALPETLKHENPNINAMYRELAVKGGSRCRADALLLRTFLEFAVYDKMLKSGELELWNQERRENFRKKNVKRKEEGKHELTFADEAPKLRDLLNWIAKESSNIIKDVHVKKALVSQLKENDVMTLLNLPAHTSDWAMTDEKAASLITEFHGLITKELMSK